MANNNKKVFSIDVEGVIGYHVTPDDIKNKLRLADGNPIEVRFASPGGFIFPGLQIFNLFKNYEGEKTAILSGLAASMASYIPLAFDYIKAEENAVYMIHNAQIGAGGDHNALRKVADIMERMSNMLAQAYVKKTGKIEKEVKSMMDNETFLFGQEIKDHGFVDEIIPAKKAKTKEEAIVTAQAEMSNCMAILKSENKEDYDKAAALLKDFKMESDKSNEAENIDPEMPYPNEHACRVREPSEFQADSFRRISAKSKTENKNYDIIIGKLKGKTSTTAQAYRYPKDTWTEAEARAHCKRNDGKTFDPATGEYTDCNCQKTSTHIENNTAKAETNKRRFINMSLKQFLNENPQAKAEFETELAAAKLEGKKEAHATFTAIEPFLNEESTYPKAIVKLAFSALKGDVDKGSFLAAAAAYDGMIEKQKSDAAKAETEQLGDTKNEMPKGANPVAQTVDDVKALAEIDKGMR